MNESPPNRTPVECLALVRKMIARRVSALASAARRVRAGDDTEGTHDLRVSARSLEAMLRTWDCLFPAQPRKEAIRALRQVRRRLGRARELQVHVSLLEPRAWQQGEPVARLLLLFRERLRRRALRAARVLRPRRFERLLGRVEAATAGLETMPEAPPHLLDRARARALEAGAVARVALELACAREDEWMLHQARIAAKKWRYAAESVEEIATLPGSHVLRRLREVQTALGTFQDRATLMEALVRSSCGEERAGLQQVLDELDREKQAAIREFRALAPGLDARPPASAPARTAGRRPARAVTAARVNGGAGAPVNGGHSPTPANGGSAPASERWEKMAQWLMGASAAK